MTGNACKANLRPRLAVIASHPVQYQVPLWRAIFSSGELDGEVLYASLAGAQPFMDPGFGRMVQWDVPVLEGYPWQLLPNVAWPVLNWRFRYCVPGVGRTLARGCFTHVLFTGKEFAYYHQALLAARQLRLATLYRAESHPPKKGRVQGGLARVSRRFWYRRLDAFLYVGNYQREEYARAGIDPERMYFAPYCTDNDYFMRQRDALQSQRAAIRQAYGFAPEDFVIGYAGKFYAQKNPVELVRAIEILGRKGRACGLLMAGDGPLRPQCETLARAIHNVRVCFPGFLNQSEIGRAYVAMDMLAMPSIGETWGLALNEAMLFGLPVVASSGVNAARDLIDEGVNGYVYPAGDPAALASSVRQVITDIALGHPMGAHSAYKISGYSVSVAAEGVLRAVADTVNLHETKEVACERYVNP